MSDSDTKTCNVVYKNNFMRVFFFKTNFSSRDPQNEYSESA